MAKDPRGCYFCGRPCHRRIVHAVPAGWARFRSSRTGHIVILCPRHKNRIK